MALTFTIVAAWSPNNYSILYNLHAMLTPDAAHLLHLKITAGARFGLNHAFMPWMPWICNRHVFVLHPECMGPGGHGATLLWVVSVHSRAQVQPCTLDSMRSQLIPCGLIQAEAGWTQVSVELAN